MGVVTKNDYRCRSLIYSIMTNLVSTARGLPTYKYILVLVQIDYKNKRGRDAKIIYWNEKQDITICNNYRYSPNITTTLYINIIYRERHLSV